MLQHRQDTLFQIEEQIKGELHLLFFIVDPCKDAKCRVKEKCLVENGEAVCVPEYTGICWAWGDPHYHTFDNYNYNFQGTCRYIISKTCGDLDGLVPFSITEKNDNRGNRAVSFVRDVEVSVYGYSISVYKNQVGKVTVRFCSPIKILINYAIYLYPVIYLFNCPFTG